MEYKADVLEVTCANTTVYCYSRVSMTIHVGDIVLFLCSNMPVPYGKKAIRYNMGYVVGVDKIYTVVIDNSGIQHTVYTNKVAGVLQKADRQGV